MRHVVPDRQIFESGLTRFCEAIGVPLMGGDAQAPATHLLFVDTPVMAADQDRLDDSPFRFANLLERRFVDLGRGLPGPFDDLVPTGVPNPFNEAGKA
ncbi:MAG: hypothetical protein NXI21_07480 [Alphaproteobacteria bacterium]|nr:hypothetical protein [Alphaproteobacteria bacterium]